MATAATLQSGQPRANPNSRIFTILQESKISQELKKVLESAAEAFSGKSYKTAAKYYNAALDSWTAKEQKHWNQTIILTKYMLCICWLESTDAKDLLDSLKTLKDLEKSYGYEYPMLYYAVGKAYFKLYRFNEADEILKKGFSVLNGDIHVNEFNIPGTNIVIPESSRERLVAALVTLNEQCSSWHRPDAVCCMPDCSSHSHNEGIDKHIFFGSPTFNGMVQVSCNNPNLCIMNFHSACWKAKKEQLCSLGKMSEKDVLNWECFTPNCENQGVRCTIKKIEIYDENAELKAVVETRPEDVVWHAKPNPPPKGAIRKQQQQQTPKIKVPSAESRPVPYDRPVRPHSVPNNVSAHNNTLTHRMKIEENEDEDDIHDEQALKASIEKLQELRANNFGIRDDAIWRPDLQMYGNEYMLATAELIPDPDFGDSGVEEADLKAFFFSYFFEFVSANGPMKLDVLAEKWIEAKDIHVNSDAVLKPYLDITEFLLQSVKFAVIGDYICVAGKLPDAYELAKNDTCTILRFFMENDIDQRSNSSSVDDDAAFDALIINHEKNNNSLPYSSVSVDDKVIPQESVNFSNPPPDIHKKDDKKSINNLKVTEAAESIPSPTPKTAKTKSLSKSTSNTQENGKITTPEIVGASKTMEEKKQTPPSQIPAEKNVPVATPTRKSEKRPYSPDYQAAAVADKKSEPIVKKTTENRNESSTKAINGFRMPQEKEPFVFPPLKSSFSFEKCTEPIETSTKESKLTDDLRESVASLDDDHKVWMNNSGGPEDEILAKRFLSSPRKIEADSSKAAYEKFVDSHEVFNKILRNLTAELVENKGKTLRLESELEYEKERHAAMRVRMLQKSLHCQYAYNQSKIMMKIEECRRNIDVCASIQAMLKNTVGHNMPNYETKWTNVIEELEKISNNHEKQFNEINEQLLTSKDPEKFEKVDLQLEPLPAMPQTQLTDVIQAAFTVYRMQQTKEFQRMLPPPAPAVRPSQPQQIGNPQHWQMVQGNPLVQQQNYMRNLAPMPQRNSANPVPPHLQPMLGNVPPPAMNFPYFSYTGMPYQQVNPSVPQMQPIPSGPMQQQVFNAPQQATSETQQQKISPVQRNSSPVHQIARPQPQNAPSPNFAAPERPKLNPSIQSPSPLAKLQTFSNFTHQNGQFSEKSVNSSMTFEELTAKFKKGTSSFVPPELPTVSSANERSSTPVLKNSTFSANGQNLEQPTTANSQGAISVPEVPKIFKGQEHDATTAQKTFSSQENMGNADVSKICVEKFKQLDLNKKDQPSVATETNGAKKKKQQNFNSNILQAPLLFRDEPQVNTQEDIHVRSTENTPEPEPSVKSETVLKVNEKENDIAAVIKASNAAPQEAQARKKSEHSIDKLMKRLRKQYAGVLELDLLKGVESVRKLHNNSLSGVPISEIVREANRFILDRQQKQLCGYMKRMPNAYYAASNTGDRSSWTPIVEEERKRQTSVSSTSSASSLKKEAQNSYSKKKWEPVVTPNDGWKKETPESDCTICLESMLHTASYTLQCKHTFHKTCIKNWYQHNQSCPTCRVHSTIDDEYPPLPLG